MDELSKEIAELKREFNQMCDEIRQDINNIIEYIKSCDECAK